VEKSELIGVVDLLQEGLKKKKVPTCPPLSKRTTKPNPRRKIQILTVPQKEGIPNI
jgi:hypothetical protein